MNWGGIMTNNKTYTTLEIDEKFKKIGYKKRNDSFEEVLYVNRNREECDCFADFIYFYPENCSYSKSDVTGMTFKKLTDEEYDLIIALCKNNY